MKTVSEKCGLINLVSGVLMVIMVVLCCTGYFQTDSGSYSAMGYVSLPSAYPELEAYLQENVADFNVNDVVSAPLWVFCIGIIASVLCFMFRDSAFTALAPLAWSAGGIVFYLMSPYMKLGGTYWLHIAIMVVVLLISVLNLLGLKDNLKA